MEIRTLKTAAYRDTIPYRWLLVSDMTRRHWRSLTALVLFGVVLPLAEDDPQRLPLSLAGWIGFIHAYGASLGDHWNVYRQLPMNRAAATDALWWTAVAVPVLCCFVPMGTAWAIASWVGSDVGSLSRLLLGAAAYAGFQSASLLMVGRAVWTVPQTLWDAGERVLRVQRRKRSFLHLAALLTLAWLFLDTFLPDRYRVPPVIPAAWGLVLTALVWHMRGRLVDFLYAIPLRGGGPENDTEDVGPAIPVRREDPWAYRPLSFRVLGWNGLIVAVWTIAFWLSWLFEYSPVLDAPSGIFAAAAVLVVASLEGPTAIPALRTVRTLPLSSTALALRLACYPIIAMALVFAFTAFLVVVELYRAGVAPSDYLSSGGDIFLSVYTFAFGLILLVAGTAQLWQGKWGLLVPLAALFSVVSMLGNEVLIAGAGLAYGGLGLVLLRRTITHSSAAYKSKAPGLMATQESIGGQ
jgi:hypothetical protein